LLKLNAKETLMKKRFFVCGSVIIVLLAGCSAASSPKAVVEKFYKAVEKNDTKAIAEVATPETAQTIALFGSMFQEAMKENGKFKIGTETIDGDTAVVTLVYENGKEETVDLVKVDGKWKVAIKK
jgi:outer membrane lipoprotein-sorting protein